MDENKFWVRIWSMVIAFFACVVITLGVSSMVADYHMRLLIEQGVDPIAANCAITGVKGAEGSKLLICEKAIAAPRSLK